MTYVVVFAIVAGMYVGFRRGFLCSAFKLLTAVLSVVLSYFLAPLIANFVIEFTQWDDKLQASITAQIEANARTKIEQQLNITAGEYGIPVTEEMIDAALNAGLSEEQKADMLEQITIPDTIRDTILQNETAVGLDTAASAFYQYVAGCLAKMIVRAIVYVSVFILITILLFICYKLLSFVLRMASLGGLNRAAGALFGGVQVVIYIWLAFIVIHYISASALGTSLLAQIQNNVLLRWLDEYNYIQPIVNRTIAGIF